jgi:5-methylcytosine-specific restriction endonuclease McrA
MPTVAIWSICEVCGAEFQKKRTNNKGRFCSLLCYCSWRKKRAEEVALDGLSKQKRWYLKNPDKVSQYNVAYIKEHAESIKEYKHNFYLLHKEDCLLKQQRRRESMTDADKNKERIRKQLWKKQNKDTVNAYERKFRRTPQGRVRTFYNNSRHRMGKVSLNTKILSDWVESQKVHGELFCFYCGKFCSKDYEIDHYMPIAKGGQNSLKNFRIACPICNRKKSCKLPEDFTGRKAELSDG